MVSNNWICCITHLLVQTNKGEELICPKNYNNSFVYFFHLLYLKKLTRDFQSVFTCQPVHFGFAWNQERTQISSPAWTKCYRINKFTGELIRVLRVQWISMKIVQFNPCGWCSFWIFYWINDINTAPHASWDF